MAKKTRTEAQRNASRRNGKESRGPKTPEGKLISSKNATKHGLLAAHVAPPVESRYRPVFMRFLREFRKEYDPQTITDVLAVERLATMNVFLARAYESTERRLAPTVSKEQLQVLTEYHRKKQHGRLLARAVRAIMRDPSVSMDTSDAAKVTAAIVARAKRLFCEALSARAFGAGHAAYWKSMRYGPFRPFTRTDQLRMDEWDDGASSGRTYTDSERVNRERHFLADRVGAPAAWRSIAGDVGRKRDVFNILAPEGQGYPMYQYYEPEERDEDDKTLRLYEAVGPEIKALQDEGKVYAAIYGTEPLALQKLRPWTSLLNDMILEHEHQTRAGKSVAKAVEINEKERSVAVFSDDESIATMSNLRRYIVSIENSIDRITRDLRSRRSYSSVGPAVEKITKGRVYLFEKR